MSDRLGGFTGCKTIRCAFFDIDTVNMYTYSCTLLWMCRGAPRYVCMCYISMIFNVFASV